MRITAIRQKTVPLAAPMRNAGIAYDEMTASVVVVKTDGPHVGLGFDLAHDDRVAGAIAFRVVFTNVPDPIEFSVRVRDQL